MKKIILLAFVVCIIMACKSTPVDENNPGVGPELTVVIPELFSPSPDVVDDTMTILITVKHTAVIKDWHITIQAMRQRLTPEQLAQLSARGDQARQRTGQQRQRQAFFEQTGAGTPPARWAWNGRSTSRLNEGGVGEMVQSATAYQFVLAVSDIFGNSSTYEGIINVDVIVRRDGDKLRIVVPAITFEADQSNFSQVVDKKLSEEEVNSNRRVLRLIANALGKYPGYNITIEGHANPTTAPKTRARTNEEDILKTLSERRARAVGEYLTANHNINAARFKFAGMGADRVVVDFNDDAEEKWKNRRVEFILDR